MWRPVKVHEPFWWRHLPPWAVRASVMLLIVLAALLCALLLLRIRCGITASILLFVPSPSHGLISLVPWDSTASVADLETVAVNSPRILRTLRRLFRSADRRRRDRRDGPYSRRGLHDGLGAPSARGALCASGARRRLLDRPP